MNTNDAITKAVEALKKCIDHFGDENPDDDWDAIRDACEALAALTALQEQPAPVRVKPLEWTEAEDPGKFCLASWFARNPAGRGGYSVEKRDYDRKGIVYVTSSNGREFPSLEAAQSAVWVGHEAGVLSALSPAPEGVKVGPLLWSKYGEALGFSAKYSVYEAGSGWNCVKYPVIGDKTRIAEGVTEKEAIAAAQNDYSSEVLSALQPSPARW